MASYTARKNKAGEIVSYQIKVSRGRDKLTGKQLTPYTMTFTPPEGWSKRAIERELLKVMGEFETACNRGEILTKEEQKAAAQQAIEEEKRRQIEEAQQPFFPDYVKQFLKDREIVNAHTTIRCYEKSLKRAVTYFEGVKIKDITPAMCRKFITYLQTEAISQNSGKPLKIGTVQHDYNVLKTLFQSAEDLEIIENNPMSRVKMPTASKDEESKEAVVYDEKQVQYIIDCLNNEPLMWRCLVLFLIYSGCRRGEAAGLMWSDIDFKTGEITIQHTRQYTEKQGVYTTTPKSSKKRTIFINETLLHMMKIWKSEQAKRFLRLGIQNKGFCFTSQFNTPLHPNSIGLYFRGFGKKYNLPGIHPHALRHTMATISIANGADIVSVSKKLGHSNTSITLNVYTHANEEAQRRANDIFDNAIATERTKHA